MKDMGIRDKVAIITGATSGIGKATAYAFAHEKAKVILLARDRKMLEEITSDLKNRYGAAYFFAADLCDVEKIKQAVRYTVDIFGGIDVLVNSAGIIGSGSIESTSLSEWDEMMNINLRSIFFLCQTALPYLIERKGNIVNVSSVTGLRAFPNVFAYCVSKAGLDQFTRCAALELAAKGVRVNAVNPGVTLTQLHRRGGMDDKSYQAFLERSQETHPLGRVGNPDEIADLILYLASPRAGWITGVTYSIDGGRAQTCAR